MKGTDPMTMKIVLEDVDHNTITSSIVGEPADAQVRILVTENQSGQEQEISFDMDVLKWQDFEAWANATRDMVRSAGWAKESAQSA